MARFNESKRGAQKTRNIAGGNAYKTTWKEELYALACTGMLQPKYYTPNPTDDLKRIRAIIENLSARDNEWVGKLAVYARERMHLRSVPLVLAVELARADRVPCGLVRRVVERIISRPDEATEILAYYKSANERKTIHPLDHQIQKGLADAFVKWDEYQLAKYNRDGEFKLRDVLFLSRPRQTKPEQAELWRKLADDALAIPYTWETQLSERGNKKEVWEEIITSGKLPYMATIRNLRNMLNVGIEGDHLNIVCKTISDPVKVASSRQLPYRFYSAARAIEGRSFAATALTESLEEAMIHSAENIPLFGFDSKVVVFTDTSGSMRANMSERSSVEYYEVGALMAAMVHSRCKAVKFGHFAERAEWLPVPTGSGNVIKSVLGIRDKIGRVGYGTSGDAALHLIERDAIDADYVLMFTDMQIWLETYGGMAKTWARIKAKNPKTKIILFDLAGHGTTPLSFSSGGVYQIAGFSDRSFEAIEALESGGKAIDLIDAVEL